MNPMSGMQEDPGAILPEIILLAGAIVGLLVGLFLPRRRQWLVAVIAAAVLLAAIAASAVAATRPARLVFGQSYAVDTVLCTGRLIALAAALLTLCLSVEQVRGHKRETEYYVLVLAGALGVIVLTGASDLLLLVAGYLLASVPLYALTAFAKDKLGTEAALKYYLMGALAGIVMLFGVMILYGLGGGTSYALLGPGLATASPAALAVAVTAVLAGLAFKLGAVPVHFWVPDVTEGAPLPVAAFVTTVPKIGGLLAAFRLLDLAVPASRVDWPLLVAVIATASMTLGNLAAFWQTSPRRLLAYSTISQVGYLLLGVVAAPASNLALRGLLFYAAAYAATNLGAFGVVLELPRARRLDDYAGLFRRQPLLALALTICLLGFIGTPPTAVFVGKVTVFGAAIDSGHTWLAVVAILNTVASVFYYLRWLAPTFLRPPAETADALVPAGAWTRAGAYTATAISLLLGLLSGVVLSWIHNPPISG
jgi:NADH-quinone oxidoreductase subunit N